MILPVLAITISQLVHACVPSADSRSVAAIVQTESSYNPWALSINRPAGSAAMKGLPPGRLYLTRQPKSKAEALEWARRLMADHYTLSVGLMQVSTESGYSVRVLLDPCSNVKIGWSIFLSKYQQAAGKLGHGQRAVHSALSLYNSGTYTLGFQNGYVSKTVKNSK